MQHDDRNYVYEALPLGNKIRYMVLHSGGEDEPLACSLAVGSIDEVPPFEAISYVWGSTERKHEVMCSDKYGRQGRLFITQNLHEVLKRLRLSDAPRTLWADSICINQDNITEQGHQVSLMARIYRSAARVLVVVDPHANPHANAAKAIIEEVYQWIHMTLQETEYAPDSFPPLVPETPFLYDDRWDSVALLARQPWFRRGWVVQEAGLAKQATAIWGDVDFEWRHLLTVFMWIESRTVYPIMSRGVFIAPLHLFVYADQTQREALSFQSRLTSFNRDLHFLLGHARSQRFTDDRDRVYAFLGLRPNLSFEPDYSLPVLDVYLQFARNYLLTTQNLTLLSEVFHTEATLGDGIPSWVPRWDLPVYLAIITKNDSIVQSASSPAGPVVIEDNDALRVRGVLFDSIQACFPVSVNEDNTLQQVDAAWRSLLELCVSLPSPYPPGTLDLAFSTTLTGNTYVGDLKDWIPELYAFRQHLQKVRRDPAVDDAILEELDRRAAGGDVKGNWFISLSTYLFNTQLVVTKRGYLGLSSGLVHEGDICAVFFGARNAFALRPAERAGCFKLLGIMSITSAIEMEFEKASFFPDITRVNAQDWLAWSREEEDITIV